MKYLTKEWYDLCQKTSFHLGLEEDKQAEKFSEEYFNQLYNNELNSWLDLQKEIHFNMETTYDNNEYEPFIREKEMEEFHNIFISNQGRLKEELPEIILNQIADLRVFALNKASRNVIQAVTKFCEENERAVTKVSKDYRSYLKENSIVLDKEVVKNFSFHDCTIIKSIKNDRSLKLLLDNTGGFTNIDEVIFENFNIIKQDDLLEDSWWLYEEVYRVNDKYELHVLLHNKTMDLMDFIISAEQIYFKSNKSSYL